MDDRLRQLLVAAIALLAVGFSALALRPALGTRLVGLEGRWALGFAVAYLVVAPVALLGGELYLSRLVALVAVAVGLAAVVPLATPTVWERFAGLAALFPLVVVAPKSWRGKAAALAVPVCVYAVLAYRYLFASTVGAGIDFTLATATGGYLAAMALGLPLAAVGLGLHRPETDRLGVV
jgi:hypothetical protein